MRPFTLLLAAAMACNGGSDPADPTTTDPGHVTDPGPGDNPAVGTQTGDGGDLGTLQDPGDSRASRRMNVDQLSESMKVVTNSAGWVDSRGDDQFVELADTLGKADYLERVSEDLTPSLLFSKFMDEAAHDTCDMVIDDELDGKSPLSLIHI